MTLSIELSPELEAKVEQSARFYGLPVEAYIRQLIATDVPTIQPGLQAVLPPEEFARVLKEWAEEHQNWPILPEEAFSREAIYGDCD
jgi:hypothetical protein